MIKFILATLAVVLALAPPLKSLADGAPELLHQTVFVDGVSAEVSVSWDVQQVGHRVDAIFRTAGPSSLHVACLSPYRDLRFDLYHVAGKPVPINLQGLAHPPYSGPSDLYSNYRIGSGAEIPCAEMPVRQANLVAFLAPLYPNLPPGNYVLRLTFAPRGQAKEAPFAPMHVVVDGKHPL